tara:strand:+ start:91 stop:672 length:582 start_codon:yes stop_codon:yes gene_type:complete
MALVNCTECNKEVSDKAQSCPNCGNPMATGETQSDVVSPPSIKENQKACPYCGNPVFKDATKCNNCTGDLPFCPKCNETVAVNEKNKFVGVARGGTQKVWHCKNCGKKLHGPDCFIATAAYGSTLASEIDHLRYWRDHVLRRIILGELFIEVYYLISPSIARIISGSNFLRLVTRLVLYIPLKIIKTLNKTPQ